MIRRFAFCVVVLSVPVGCDSLMTRQAPVRAPAAVVVEDIDSAMAASRRLSADGRWAEAIDVIARAQRRAPEDLRLAVQREQLQQRWERVRRVIDDQIMIAEAEANKNRLDWLEKLSRARPDDLLATSRRIFAREELNGRLPALLACSEWHVEIERELARRCYALAVELAMKDEDRALLQRVVERLQATDVELAAVASRQTRQRSRKAQLNDDQRRAREMLSEAKQAVDAEEYRRALDTLDEVAALQPNNPEIADLRQAAQNAINPQIEALVKLGDHLYLDEQLEAALATWQAALSLSPQDQEIVSRIDRANTVLSKLQHLRRQQGRR
jgi:tetratricopeptide (TPR) repeat protein